MTEYYKLWIFNFIKSYRSKDHRSLIYLCFHLSFLTLACCVILNAFFVVCWFFFKINLFEKLFHEYHQSVKQFGSRSGPTFSWSGSKLFATVISRKQKWPLAGKELIFEYLPCKSLLFIDIWSNSLNCNLLNIKKENNMPLADLCCSPWEILNY